MGKHHNSRFRVVFKDGKGSERFMKEKTAIKFALENDGKVEPLSFEEMYPKRKGMKMELELIKKEELTRCSFCGHRIPQEEAIERMDSETLNSYEICRSCDEAVS